MQELKKKEALRTEEHSGRLIIVYIQSRIYRLDGNWDWDGHMQQIFCSDVFGETLPDFEGTRAIIHPDDLTRLAENINTCHGFIDEIGFRIINTYGEIKCLQGKQVIPSEIEDGPLKIESSIIHRHIESGEQKKEIKNLQLVQQVYGTIGASNSLQKAVCPHCTVLRVILYR